MVFNLDPDRGDTSVIYGKSYRLGRTSEEDENISLTSKSWE